jgi:hypothetical protein
VVLGALKEGRGVGTEEIKSKLLSFGVDGITIFQGARTSVAKQLQTKDALFMVGVHCFAHCVNLAARTLSSNSIFQ